MERIFYKTGLCDEASNVPMYIFDTSFLPAPDVINYDEFIVTMVTLLPQEKYTLIMFSGGLNKISWVWGLKFLKRFLTDDVNIQNITKILSVHDSWFVKSLTSILANYNATRKNLNSLNRLFETFSLNGASLSSSIIVNCSTLAELNNYVDITKLKISLNTYKHDYELTATDSNFLNKALGFGGFKPFDSANFSITESSSEITEEFKYHFYQILNIVNSFGPRVELLFHKPGKKINSEVFYHCVKRNQLLWINDFDMYCIGTTFKKLINDLPAPLIPRSMIKLPIRNENIEMNFNTILNHHSAEMQAILIHILNLFRTLIDNAATTKLKSATLAKSFTTCMSFEVNAKANEPNIIIINTFVRKLIDHWGHMRKDYPVLTIKEILQGKDIDHKHGNDSYVDYDMTAEEDDPDSENVVDTSSILPEELSPAKKPPNVLKDNQNILNRATVVSTKQFQVDTSKTTFQKSVSFASPTKLNQTFLFNSPTEVHTSPTRPVRVEERPRLNDSPSKVTAQFPPQKYKFTPTKIAGPAIAIEPPTTPVKKPVIRGRKVSELARLYEERAQGLQILKGM